MSEAGIATILDKLAPLMVSLATLVMAFAAWRNSKGAKAEVVENTRITTEVHKLVNGMSLAGLGREKGDKDRIADLTGAPGDLAAAAQAHENYDVKKADDAAVEAARVAEKPRI